MNWVLPSQSTRRRLQRRRSDNLLAICRDRLFVHRFVLPMAPPLSIRSCRLDYGGVIDNETKQFDDILETAGIDIGC